MGNASGSTVGGGVLNDWVAAGDGQLKVRKIGGSLALFVCDGICAG